MDRLWHRRSIRQETLMLQATLGPGPPAKNALRSTKSGSASSLALTISKIDPQARVRVFKQYLGGSEDD